MNGFVTERTPPSVKRADGCGGGPDLILTEAAVMLATAMWAFERGASTVDVHPDGMHVKQFDVAGWLERSGFDKIKCEGKTKHGGVYRRGNHTLGVRFRPGFGDVVADVGRERVCVEAKGGCINTKHAGEVSRLRSRMHEAVGSLFDPPEDASRLIAAVPRTPTTERLGQRMAKRCWRAGIEIALVSTDGSVSLVFA